MARAAANSAPEAANSAPEAAANSSKIKAVRMPHHKQKLRFGNQLSPNDLEENATGKAIVNYYRCKIDDVKAKLHIILSSPYYDATSRWTD